MDVKRTVTYDLADYLGMARRSWWVLVLCTALGIGAAYAYTGYQAKEFESTTKVQVLPTTLDANASGGRTSGAINLDTEAQLVQSVNVAALAHDLMQSPLQPSDLLKNVSVSVPPNSTVLEITFAASTAPAARAGSHAFAEAYLSYRGDSEKAAIAIQVAGLQTQMKPLQTQLQQIEAKLPTLSGNSPDKGYLTVQAKSLQDQLSTLAAKVNTLNSTIAAPGNIISDANLPSKPSQPVLLINLASGALLGLIIGLAIAVVRERRDRTLRRSADITRRWDLPVLAELPPRVRPMLNDLYPISGTAGRTFGRLRNEIVASLDDDQRIIVVTGASRGASSTVVAANVASSFARAGERVVLIGANVVPGGPLSRIVDVSAAPGLLDVLSGRVALADALQRAARCPGLAVLAVGGAASAAGLFQAEAVRSLLDELTKLADFVVIEAPSTAATPDAQSLAALADAAIITVEIRRTTHYEIGDAVDQIRRVCPVVLGAVALPRFDNATKDAPIRDLPNPRGGSPYSVAIGGNPPMATDTAETQLFAKVDKSIVDDLDDDDVAGADQEKAPDSATIVMRRVSLEELEVTGADGSTR